MSARRRWSFFMSPMEHAFVRWIDDRYNAWLTPAGRMLLFAFLAAGTLLAGGIVAALVVVFACLLAAFVAAFAVGAPFRPRLTLQRRLPPPASAGETIAYRVTVTNESGRVARAIDVCERDLPYELRPVDTPPPISRVLPGERCEVVLKLACLRRGAYELPSLQAASSFPSGVWKWGTRARSGERLLVYPRIEHLAGFSVPPARNHQPGGIAVASHVGDSTELFGTREFRSGDRVRDIHWPSSARSGRLVVKEFQEEYFVRLALVIDAEAPTAKDEARFERGVSVAAGIADVLARKDYVIDIFAAGREVHRFRAGRALAHFDNILQLLACLDSGDFFDVGALEAELLPEARQLSAVVLVLLAWDARREAFVQLLRSHGLTVRVVVVGAASLPRGLAEEEWVPA